MGVRLIINSCLECPNNEYRYGLEEHICRVLFRRSSKFILGKPYGVSSEFAKQFVSYGERGNIPNECPLEND